MRVVTAAIAVVLTATPLVAQAPSAEPRFEIASVKPSADPAALQLQVRPDGLTLGSVPLRDLIAFAYDLGTSALDSRLIGGPGDLLTTPYTVIAKAPDRVTPADMRAMLRTLLTERFNLRLHSETREIPVFALMRLHPDRLGKNLKPSQVPDCTRFQLSIEGLATLSAPKRAPRCPSTTKMEPSGAINKVESGPISALIASLGDIVVSRPIVDATGLQGTFDWQLRYQMLMTDDPDTAAPSVLDAVPEQLGLKLEPRRAPVPVLVIDRLERPTPN